MPVNIILDTLAYRWSKHRSSRDLCLEYCLEVLDDETIHFVGETNVQTLSRKNIADLNEIVKYPTSLATPLTDTIKSRYYFSTNASRFDYFYLKVYASQRELIGVMLLNIEGGELKLLYYFYRSDNVLDELFDVVLMHAIRLKAELITSYDDRFIKYVKDNSKFPVLHTRKRVRKSFLPNIFKTFDLAKYKIFDGDGA